MSPWRPICPYFLNFGRVRPNLSHDLPTWVRVGPIRFGFDLFLPNLAFFLADFGEARRTWVEFCPGRIWAKIGPTSPKLAQRGPNLAKLGRIAAELTQFLGQQLQIGQGGVSGTRGMWAACARNWEETIRHGGTMVNKGAVQIRCFAPSSCQANCRRATFGSPDLAEFGKTQADVRPNSAAIPLQLGCNLWTRFNVC